jgi:hypothetical protein
MTWSTIARTKRPQKRERERVLALLEQGRQIIFLPA